MKFTTLLFPAVVLGAACPYGHDKFQPELETDTRGVCPMLNALSNHGFLPHSGRDISENQTVTALNEALNLDYDFGTFLFRAARISNPKPNATTFNLDHLNRHNLFEHDGSLSRQDAHFGDQGRFNQTIWDWSMQYFTGDILDVQMVANARASRHVRSMITNPEYKLSSLGFDFSTGEGAAILSIMGDKVSQTVPKKFIDFLFVNEKLPYSVGWSKPKAPITLQDLIRTKRAIEDATSFPPMPPADNSGDVFN